MKHKTIVGFDLDGVVLDTTPAVIQLHFELTGEIPKIHHSKTVEWNFQDIITATDEMIDSYFQHPRLFEIITFISDAKLSMKSLVEELIASKDFEVVFISKGTPVNHQLKRDWLKERLFGFKQSMYQEVCITENGKPNVPSDVDIFIDDVDKNFNGHAKQNVLFRKNGLITDYNKNSRTCDWITENVSELANLIFDIERSGK